MRRPLSAALTIGMLASVLAFAPAPTDLAGRMSAAEADLTAYVDPTIGSTPPGFTNPGPTVPHGMVSPGPDTEGPANYGGYYAHNTLITGFSQTHMSAGVYQGGVFPVLPTTASYIPPGDISQTGYPQPVPAYSQPASIATQTAKPGYYSVVLDEGAITVELTATNRVAYHRYSFMPSTPQRVIVDATRSLQGYLPSSVTRLDDTTLLLRVDQRSPAHSVYGALRFAQLPTMLATFDGAELTVGDTIDAASLVADFDTEGIVELQLGLSFTDAEGALANLDAETDGVSFNDAVSSADALWEEVLGLVEVTSATELLGTVAPRADVDKVRLYTALYHHRLFPNEHSDVDGRYRGPDDAVHTDTTQPHYSQLSLWDSYRGQNALLAVLDPARYEQMLVSIGDFADQHGTLPRWQLGPANPGYMSGDPAIQFIASGVCRDIGDEQLQRRLLSDVLDSRAARPAALDELGYLAVDQPDTPLELADGGGRNTGTTLEFSVADAAAALLADRLGEDELAASLVEDSLRYRNVQDPTTGWIRPRDADGAFVAGAWSPELGYGFQEGTSWQYSWLAMHDWDGLVEGMGGDAVVQQRLDTFFNLGATLTNGFAWSNVQNKQTAFGIFYAGNQYAPGNEHDLEAPYAYNAAGAPWKTQAAVRSAASAFSATVDGLPGNDDLGALSGWLVWTLLGVHPTIPGAPLYLMGSPTFPHAVIHTPTGDLEVTAFGADELNRYVHSPSLGGDPLDATWFTEDAWREAGTLSMHMTVDPDRSWGTAPEARPPSVTDGLDRFGC